MSNGAALILFMHGARDPEWARPMHRIREAILARRPQLKVEMAFLEFMTPTLGEVVDRLAATGERRLVVAPLFMAQAGHVKRDFPGMVAALRAAHPGVTLEVLPAIGEVDAVLRVMADWLVAATEGPAQCAP
jgi:sirohydrochlorin cobaltochelatase